MLLRGVVWLPREAAASPPAGPLQRAGAACRQRERPATTVLRPHAHADHRRGMISIIFLVFQLFLWNRHKFLLPKCF